MCVRTALSLRFSLSLARFFSSFLIDTKRQAVCAYTRVALSRFVCSVLDGSVSLCALLIFLPPYRIRVYVCEWVSVCVRFARRALSLCQLLILYKHTLTHSHTRARSLARSRILTLTDDDDDDDDDGKRGTHIYTDEVGGKWKTIREDHLIQRYLLARYTRSTSVFSHFVPFRWRHPVECSYFDVVTARWFFSFFR